MQYKGRFALNLLAPAPIAATLIAIGACVNTASLDPLALLPLMVLVGYLYAGLPSLAHALILQRHCYRRGDDPRRKRALTVSTLNGLLAGTAIYFFFVCIGGFAETLGMLLFPPLGAVTGALNALLHRIPCRIPRRPLS